MSVLMFLSLGSVWTVLAFLAGWHEGRVFERGTLLEGRHVKKLAERGEAALRALKGGKK